MRSRTQRFGKVRCSTLLSIVDQWTELIRKDTDQRLPLFEQHKSNYDNSLNLFKVVNMVLYLKNDLGIDYNLEIMRKDKLDDSRDLFIHGCLMGKKQGACVSIPTLCVAIGRRLGYPLKLVTAREHVFFRWDDGKENFNLEASCQGCDSKPDDYYRNWPHKVDEADVKMCGYLKSLTSADELSLFLDTRGHCFYDMGNTGEALACYTLAYKFSPNLDVLGHVNRALGTELEKYQRMKNEINNQARGKSK
jgi:hypothetical protein